MTSCPGRPSRFLKLSIRPPAHEQLRRGRGGAEVPALPRGIKKVEPASEKSDSLRQLATQRFTPIAEKRGTSLRLEPWLDNELNKRMYFLKAEGYRKITREAII